MADTSKHTTANETIADIDPGGTRPTKAGHQRKDGDTRADAGQTVVSGDQNEPADKRAR